MSDSDSWPRNLLFKNLQKSLSRMGGAIEVASRREFELGQKKARIAIRALPLSVSFRSTKKRLCILPETALSEKGKLRETGNLLIADADKHPEFGLQCFLRIEPGQTLTIGRDNANQVSLLGLGEKIGRRHLTLTLFEDELVLKNHQGDVPVKIVPLPVDTIAKQIEQRIQALGELKRLLGRLDEPMDADSALHLLESVNSLLEQEAHRPTDHRGMPGGLVSLPEKYVPVIVGDLHARIENLLVILSQPGLLESLRKGWVSLIFLGDGVHREDTESLAEMDSSMITMDMILRLKQRFPEQVFYIRGNHDSFSDEIGKGGVPQGALWRRHLKKARGKKYRKEMERFYELIPYVISSQRFFACHAGAPQSKVKRDTLINIRQYPNLEREITENRLRAPSRQKGYTKGDVKRFRKSIGMDADTPFVVGHTPLSADDTLWMNVGEIAGHHVVYTGATHWVGAMVQIGDCMVPLRYPAEPLLKLYNGLTD